MRELKKNKRIVDLNKIAEQIILLEINANMGEEEKIVKFKYLIDGLPPEDLLYLDDLIIKKRIEKIS